ncbi:MAG TPA: RluA family pseudouridine synthase [Vicinamibacterales bacterium]
MNSSWIVTLQEAGARLDKYLAAPGRLGSRAKALAALERGKVFLNDHETEAADAARKLTAGDAVRVWMDRPGSARAKTRLEASANLQIVYEDDDLLVINKPARLLAVPLERRQAAASVYDHLESHFRSRGKTRPYVVHRIDRDTSGLVVFARHPAAQAALKDQFRRREPERVYWAVVYGHPEPAEGTWRDQLVWDARALIQKVSKARDPRATEAVSDYRVLQRFPGTSSRPATSLIEVRLRTGRRNQIRLQARLRGHTLVGEKRYVPGPDERGPNSRGEPGDVRTVQFERQALHARKLSFLHPADGRAMSFEAPLPADFESLLARLRPSSL